MVSQDDEARAVASLLHKYRRMREMRREVEATPERERRASMRELAARYPGALREIDRLPMEEIESRIEALARALEGGEIPPWALVMEGYHRLLRGALAIRRAAPKGLRAGEREEAARAAAAALRPPLPSSWAEAALRPPRGRLHALALATLEAEHGLPRAAIAAAIFGPEAKKDRI